MSMESARPTNNSRRAALDALQRRANRPARSKASVPPERELSIAFSYLRVSTKEQAHTGGGVEGYSIPAQRDACQAKAAQFYSSNLAQEVMKGLVRKAEEGGTPFRAPLGYINCREMRGRIEYSWVELDPERAEIIRWCLEQYATGEWRAIDLTLAAQA